MGKQLAYAGKIAFFQPNGGESEDAQLQYCSLESFSSHHSSLPCLIYNVCILRIGDEVMGKQQAYAGKIAFFQPNGGESEDAQHQYCSLESLYSHHSSYSC